MLKMRYFGITLMLTMSSAILSCQQLSPSYSIQGEIPGGENMNVTLDQLQPDGTSLLLAKETMDGEGNFRLPFEQPLALGIYRLRIGDRNVFFALDGTEKSLNLKGPLATLDKWQLEVSGSPTAEEYIYTLRDLASLPMAGPEETRKAVEGVKNPIVAMHMAQMIYRNDPTFLDLHQRIIDRLIKDYPESEYTKSYGVYVSNVEKTHARVLLAQKVRIGEPAPDIELPDPTGKIYRLSDLKGQVVLLDFWASWCGPCRVENPKVVAVYNKYKERGFTVFSVSLDGLDERTKAKLQGDDAIKNRTEMARQQWVQAIEKDNLIWPYHVSDLKKWDADAAQLYGVTSIPKTFLIDREGKIVSMETRGVLEQEVLKLL